MSTAGAFSDGDRHALPAAPGPELDGAFRTPTLRCSAKHPSFMHTGQLTDLAQVVAFFDRGGDAAGSYPGKNELSPLGLSDGEKADLTAFLQALTGPGPSAELLSPPAD
jgi:cytochrome c peroxidase